MGAWYGSKTDSLFENQFGFLDEAFLVLFCPKGISSPNYAHFVQDRGLGQYTPEICKLGTSCKKVQFCWKEPNQSTSREKDLDVTKLDLSGSEHDCILNQTRQFCLEMIQCIETETDIHSLFLFVLGSTRDEARQGKLRRIHGGVR